MLYQLVAAHSYLITHPLLRAATAVPTPSGSATPSTMPTPTSSASSLSNVVSDAVSKAQAQANASCVKGAVSICNTVHWVTGSWPLARVLQVLLGTPLKLALIIVLGLVFRRFLVKLIERLTDRIAHGAATTGRNAGLPGGHATPPAAPEATPLTATRREARSRTLAQVLRSAVTVFVVVVVTLMIMQQLGLHTAPLLASASVVGVALGLGAQSLVRDVVAGMFMIIEDQYGVGDSIDAGVASGTVEAVGLRVTRLRDLNGTVWYVRNGEIMRVGNKSQGWSRAVLDINVGYDEDVDQVEAILLDIAEKLRAEPKFGIFILDEPEVWGVEEMTTDSVVIRLVVKTYPQQSAAVARELRRRIKHRFEVEHIDMRTMPRTVIVNEEDLDDEPTTARPDVSDVLDQ